MAGTAIICGGSIAGLFTAAALLRAGWSVDVFERSSVPLAGRGAGIVTHPELLAALEAVGADTSELGVEVFERVAYDIDGARVASLDFPQVVTSWDRMFQVLRALIPDRNYHLGHTATGYDEDERRIVCHFDGASSVEADVLIGADGYRSPVRAVMQPDIKPDYSGYLVWRALAHEADVPAEVRSDIFQTFGFFIPTGSEVIGYPIAGPDNDLRVGHRRYNFVWYRCLSEEMLRDMLVDDNGTQHVMTIAPPLIRDDVIETLYRDAAEALPRGFNDILRASARPFFTPIYDHHCPVMGRGRLALVGDAACVARPHVGMGVTKAAEDALALARCLASAPVATATAAYSAERVPLTKVAYTVAQELGAHVLDAAPGGQTDGRTHPHQDEILRETAVIPAPLRLAS